LVVSHTVVTPSTLATIRTMSREPLARTDEVGTTTNWLSNEPDDIICAQRGKN